jgi:hypothetical protein
MSSLRDRATDTIKTGRSVSQYHIPKWSNTVYDDIRTFATGMGMAQSVVDTLVEPAAILRSSTWQCRLPKPRAVVTKKVAAAAPKKVLTSKKVTGSRRLHEQKQSTRRTQQGPESLGSWTTLPLRSWPSGPEQPKT